MKTFKVGQTVYVENTGLEGHVFPIGVSRATITDVAVHTGNYFCAGPNNLGLYFDKTTLEARGLPTYRILPPAIDWQFAKDVAGAFLLIAAFIIGFLLLISCDMQVNGNTTHTVQGEATVRMEIAIDYCKDIPPEQKLECLETFADLVEMLKGERELDALITEMEGGV